MTIDVTACGGVIDQRGMTAGQRFELACVLREGWWDCYGLFMDDIVEVSETGLSPKSLEALAQDMEEAGFLVHATAVRAAALPVRADTLGADQVRMRPGVRARHGAAALARH